MPEEKVVTIETLKGVGDGKLTHEKMGMITVLVMELFRRMKSKRSGEVVTFDFVRHGLQCLAEGRMVFPPGDIHKDPSHMAFRRPSAEERAKSAVPFGTMLPHWRRRLGMPQRMPENVMAELWEAENIPRSEDMGGPTVWAIFDGDSRPSERDIQVVGSTLQWLATNTGSSFLRRYLNEANLLRYM